MTIKPKSISKRNKKYGLERYDLFYQAKDILSHIGVGIYSNKGYFVYTVSIFQKLSGYASVKIVDHDTLEYTHSR